ncbi:hypothetical protein CUMW_135910 [Citrus unshiu]|nr:hypothetical protein CUMW_135910 [Citrus unshiu]
MLGTMIKYHKNLTARGYPALICSGDHDMCILFTGSVAWTRSVGYKIVVFAMKWSSRLVLDTAQNIHYQLIILLGPGHSVAESKQWEALNFYSLFLAGKPK